MGASEDDGASVEEEAARGDDRRGEQRAPIELTVEYKRLNTFFHDYTKNISRGGTFIKTDRLLPIGTLFRFRLKVPALVDPIELRGEVRWVVRPGEPPPASVAVGQEPGMGIHFVYDTRAERQSVEQAVERLMIESLGQVIHARLMHARRPGERDGGGDGDGDAGGGGGQP